MAMYHKLLVWFPLILVIIGCILIVLGILFIILGNMEDLKFTSGVINGAISVAFGILFLLIGGIWMFNRYKKKSGSTDEETATGGTWNIHQLDQSILPNDLVIFRNEDDITTRFR